MLDPFTHSFSDDFGKTIAPAANTPIHRSSDEDSSKSGHQIDPELGEPTGHCIDDEELYLRADATMQRIGSGQEQVYSLELVEQRLDLAD